MRTSAVFLLAALTAACTTGTTATPSPAPTPSATPTASPTPVPSPPEFKVDIVPPEEPTAARTAIPGEGVCFLVVLTDELASAGPVTITASETAATVRSIEPAALSAGTVGEVWVVPDPSTIEATARVSITGTRAAVSHTVERSLPVFPMTDERATDARPYFDRWLAWLSTEHPELGITTTTTWQPEFVSTFLVVSHYAYWSPDWEIVVRWHNMIAPYDWTEVQLRHRWTEAAPSAAWRIDSVSAGTAPHTVAPDEVAIR